MQEITEVSSFEDAWKVLRKHFTEQGGLLDQMEHGRKVLVSLGDQPEEYQELRDIKAALEIIHQSWGTTDTLPKWQVCLLWRVAPRLENMLRYTAEPLPIHILHSKILKWIDNALSMYDQMIRNPESLIAHDVAMHMMALKSFTTELRFGRIDSPAFEELIQAVEVLQHFWRGRLTVPRLGARLLLFAPLESWDLKIYTDEQKARLQGMKQRLYALIEACFCED